jgi:hypothetical protein
MKLHSVFPKFTDEARDDCIAMAKLHLPDASGTSRVAFAWHPSRVREFFSGKPRKIVGASPDAEQACLPFEVTIGNFYVINPAVDARQPFWIARVCHKSEVGGVWYAHLRYLKTVMNEPDDKFNYIDAVYYELDTGIKPADLKERMPITNLQLMVSMSSKGKNKKLGQLFGISGLGKFKQRVKDAALRFFGLFNLCLCNHCFYILYLIDDALNHQEDEPPFTSSQRKCLRLSSVLSSDSSCT